MIQEPTDAIVRVTMSSICTSDLHIKHGSVSRAVPGITVGHEMVGVVEELGFYDSSTQSGYTYTGFRVSKGHETATAGLIEITTARA